MDEYGAKETEDKSKLEKLEELFTQIGDADWALKFAIMDNLHIPSTSYQRQIPAAIYDALSPDSAKNYIKMNTSASTSDDNLPPIQEYFIAIFELTFTTDQIPDEFIVAGIKYQKNYDISCNIGPSIYRAYRNVIRFREITIKKHVYEIIKKLLKVFDCKIEMENGICTFQTFETLCDIQPCLMIGNAAMGGVFINVELQESFVCQYNKFDPSTCHLLKEFCESAQRIFIPYHDELQKALDENGPRVSPAKLSIMNTVYLSFKKLVNAFLSSLDSPPQELLAMTEGLIKFYECYIAYMMKQNPNIDHLCFTRIKIPQAASAAADQIQPEIQSSQNQQPSSTNEPSTSLPQAPQVQSNILPPRRFYRNVPYPASSTIHQQQPSQSHQTTVAQPISSPRPTSQPVTSQSPQNHGFIRAPFSRPPSSTVTTRPGLSHRGHFSPPFQRQPFPRPRFADPPRREPIKHLGNWSTKIE